MASSSPSWFSPRWVTVLLALSLSIQHVVSQDSSPTGPTMPNIAPNCNKFHTVKEGSGDTCSTVAAKYSISLNVFYQLNPDVTNDCTVNFWAGYAYCVGVGPLATTTSSSSSSRSSSSTSGSSGSSGISTSSSTRLSSSTTRTTNATYSTRLPITDWNITATTIETAFPPQRTQPGQHQACNDWYLVSAGDTCESIAESNSWVTLPDLHAWNPALSEDCSGLYVGWWVCVGVRVQSVTVTFGWTTTDVPADVPTLTGEYTPTTLPSVDTSFTASPTAGPVVSGCKSYYQAKAGDTCRVIVDGVLLKQEDFMRWNPSLNGNCDGLWAGYWYCVVGPDGLTAMPPTATSPPVGGVRPPGQTSSCQRWYLREGESCDELVGMFGVFSLQDFVAWNPSVGSGCGAMSDGEWYCVGVPGTPTTRSEPVRTTDPPTTPTQSGMVSGCSRLWLVGPDDTCESISTSNSISEDQFLLWNPAVGPATCSNLLVDYYVCVEVAGGSSGGPTTTTTGSSTSTRTTITTSSTTTGGGEGPITTPSPTQAGMISGCRRFYYAQDGDGCWAIANSAQIDLNDFYNWNTALNGDCSGLWLHYWYCIGISGPVTTISSGPPVPAPTK